MQIPHYSEANVHPSELTFFPVIPEAKDNRDKNFLFLLIAVPSFLCLVFPAGD